MKKKKIVVSVLGTGKPQFKDVEIVNGTTGADLKRTLGISESYNLLRKSNNQFLTDSLDLYTLLEEGEKIEVSKDSQVAF